ncbi:MAG: hypothetical protein RMY16_08215 [Nostoc sp. DedQUE12b]|uniref:hypothetical protein n=1 Tax=Nostoc sp. DedQUE12b TaxID=3075398 RepID=UPI002AD5917D|nr:hypothetical protein [Nostoc sp. DedQUE12b]MDZ8085568.1 hypothetical protein [Nostoc sp. DedQUE12b]
MTKNKIKYNIDLNQAPVMFIEEITDDQELKSVYGGVTPPDSVLLNPKIIAALAKRGIILPNDPNNPNTLTEEALLALKDILGSQTY